MVLKECGEIRKLYKASLWRMVGAPFALNKIRCYWYVWVSVEVFLSSVWYVFFISWNSTRSLDRDLFNVGLMALTCALMLFLSDTALATEFKVEYTIHGIKLLPSWKRRAYLRYALFLRELVERGYTADTLGKLKAIVLIAQPSASNPSLLQHPLMVPFLTIGTVLSIEAIKQSEIWKTPRWWIFFMGLSWWGSSSLCCSLSYESRVIKVEHSKSSWSGLSAI
jgi:hypothetical protein